MYIAYFDESGDDGLPGSSDVFALSSVYMKDLDWQANYQMLVKFRKDLQKEFGLPIKTEIHTKQLVLNKRPYTDYGWGDSVRLDILTRFLEVVAQLKLRIINTVIVKQNIILTDYPILEKALTYNVTRIENDLVKNADPKNTRFMIITDEGRVGKMTQTTRQIQRYNPIPSKFERGKFLKREIKLLIEDPFGKNSSESYFLQISDALEQ